jgi:hypothetical protein
VSAGLFLLLIDLLQFSEVPVIFRLIGVLILFAVASVHVMDVLMLLT